MNRFSTAYLILGLAVTVLLGGCVTSYYVYPNPVAKEYDRQIPVKVGFLMSNELRSEWYTRKDMYAGRLDVPVGEIVLKHADAFLADAFLDFYTIRYEHRRSATGIVLKLDDIEYEIIDDEAYVTLTVTIEDRNEEDIMTQEYFGVGTLGGGEPLKIRVSKVEDRLAESTRLALYWAFRDMIDDVQELFDRGRIVRAVGDESL